MVKTLSRGSVRMDELKTDDWVMSSNRKQLIYEPVKQWVHRNPSQEAEFVKIDLEDGTTVKLSGKHFIYKMACDENQGKRVDHSNLIEEPEFAETVVAGDCVYRLADRSNSFVPTRVSRVSMVRETGIFSPMTVGGDIVVNNVFASCHSNVRSHPLQETFFKLVDILDRAYRVLFFGQTTASKFISESLDLPNGIGIAAEMYQLAMGAAS